MKNIVFALLSVILLVCVADLLASLGMFDRGPDPANREYKVLNAQQMDNIGFTMVAKEEGLEVSEKGEITFPKEMAEKIAKVNLLPRTIQEVEKDGGWSFVAVTSDDHYLFQRGK